jgi:hypothetical protein
VELDEEEEEAVGGAVERDTGDGVFKREKEESLLMAFYLILTRYETFIVVKRQRKSNVITQEKEMKNSDAWMSSERNVGAWQDSPCDFAV